MNWKSVEAIATLCSIGGFIAGFVSSKVITKIQMNRSGNTHTNTGTQQVAKGNRNIQVIK